MPDDVTVRHRAGGVGRVLAIRTAAPRHAVPTAQRWPWLLAVLAVLLLAAVSPLALRAPVTPRAAVPLPAISVPAPPTATTAPATARRTLHAVRQAAKAGPAPSSPAPPAPPPVPPVLLGPASDADVAPLLGSYCRATHGRFTLAAATADGWFCAPLARATVALDMDAMCHWRYGDSAWADLGHAGQPRSWRCYRDGP